mgnify:CR=1 FL=1
MSLALPDHIKAVDVVLDALQTNPDAAFKHPLVEGLAVNEQQLVRQEITRLQQPVAQIIDMRCVAPDTCQQYGYGPLKHYLTPLGVERFEYEIKRYGRYTLGVFEALTQLQHEMVTGAADATQTHNFTSPTLTFFNYPQRSSERMHFSINILLYTEQEQKHHLKTVDLSIMGLQVKSDKPIDVAPGDKVVVVLSGLANEYSFIVNTTIDYDVVRIDHYGDEMRLFLHRDDMQHDSAVTEFLSHFIRGNKYRYKINLENTINAIENKVCEQYFTPRFPSLPVFISQHNHTAPPTLQPTFAMSNSGNDAILAYWQDEQHQQRIGDLVSHARICELVAKPCHQREIFVYAFTHVQQDKVYFYSASQHELDNMASIKPVLLSYGAHKASWRVFKLQLSDMSPTQAYTPLSISNDSHKDAKTDNTPPSARLMRQLIDLRYIVLISDITDSIAMQTYQQIKLDKSKITQLYHFAHPHNQLPHPINVRRYKYADIRKETRYYLRTSVNLTIAGITIKGVTEDISGSGLRIELEQGIPAKVEDNPATASVTLDFPRLQSMTKQYDLSALRYDIVKVHANRHILHLRFSSRLSEHTDNPFFVSLITNNREKLKADHLAEETPGLAHALRCIYAKNAMNIAFFINQRTELFTPEFSIYNQGDGRLKSMLSRFAIEGHFNLEFLYRDRDQPSPFIRRCLAQLKSGVGMQEYEIFIRYRPHETHINDMILPFINQQFSSIGQRHQFIEHALDNGEFVAIRLILKDTVTIELDTLKTELDYLQAHANYKAEKVLNTLNTIQGFGYILDITDEVMYRHGYTWDAISANHHLDSTEALPLDQCVEGLL